MFQSKAFDTFFTDAVQTLEPYLNDLVCIGGCANALYRYHERASNTSLPYLGTKDMDWASPQKLSQEKRKPVAELMEIAGFKEETFGTSEKAVVKYLPKDEDLAADIEFLCPESGLKGGRKRGSGSPAFAVQPGLMAQPLRYLEMLLHRTWEISPGKIPEFQALRDLRIRVPNPAAYIVQKVLIREQRRSPQSAAKDCYYMYEVSVVFRDSFDAIGQEFEALQEKFRPWLNRFPKIAQPLFADQYADGPVSALKVFNESGASFGFKNQNLTEEMIFQSVAKLFDAMK